MRGMALANAGGRTGERDPIPEGERRADKSRREAQRGGRAEAGVEPATRRHTEPTWLVTKSTMPLYGRGRRSKGSQTAKGERRANKTPENTRRRAKPNTTGSHSVGIRQKSGNSTNSQHSIRNLAKFREIFIKIGAKFDEHCEKYQHFERNLKIVKTFRRNFAKILNWRRCEGTIFL